MLHIEYKKYIKLSIQFTLRLNTFPSSFYLFVENALLGYEDDKREFLKNLLSVNRQKAARKSTL